MINPYKSTLCFSPSTPRSLSDNMRAILGINLVFGHSKYMGFPSTIYHNRKNIFVAIKESVEKVVAKWKDRFVSIAGKEVMIKSFN